MSRLIHITNFQNPNSFYFKFDDDLHDSQLHEVEDELAKYARAEIKKPNKLSNFVIGDAVAAYEISWGKWVRAKICAHLNELNRYQLWAIDHGRSFQATCSNILPLPPHIAGATANGVSQGSLYGITPAKLDFNLETCEGEYVQTSEWSQKSIQLCRDIISGNVLDIKYDIQAKQGDVYFGHVIVTKLAKRSKTNPITNLAHALRNTDEAMEMPGFSAEMVLIERKYGKMIINGSDVGQNVAHNHSDVSGPVQRSKLHSSTPNTHSVVQSTVVPSEINGGDTRMKMKNKPRIAPSATGQSTIVPSEINGGNTRMKMKNAAPSIMGLSTVVPSEIDNGLTRMQMKNKHIGNTPNRANAKSNANERTGTRSSLKTNGKPYMPAGHERETMNFNKYNS